MELTPTSFSLGDNVKRSTHGAENSSDQVERRRRYDSALDQFVVQNGRSAPEQAAAATFVDEDGILRYVETWQVVKANAESDQGYELSSTGCITIPVKLNHDAKQIAETKNYMLSFLLDYQILWKYFEKDSVDELAEYAPLFHAYIGICFHPRTVQLMIFLTVYSLVIQFSIDQYYSVIPVFFRVWQYIHISIQCVMYLSLLMLLKGRIFAQSSGFDDETAETSEKANRVRRNIKRNKMARWVHFAQEALRTTSLELQRMFRSHRTPSPQDKLYSVTPFYDALNIAAKFLSKHHVEGSVTIGLNSPRHNLKLLFVFFGVPVYCFLSTYVTPIGTYTLFTNLCNSVGQDSSVCNNLRWVFIFTLGYLISVLQTIIFMSSVLLTLIALGFGSEIGRGLIDSWIVRFGPLRRLNEAQMKDLVSLEKSDGPIRRKSELTPSFRQRFASTPNAVVNELHKQLEKELPALPAQTEVHESTDCKCFSDILVYLPRDAYEHYLFVREFMSTGSRSWSPIIIALIFLCIVICGAVLFGTQLATLGWVYYIVWVCVHVYLLMIYPIVSLAYANTCVYALQEQFLVAAPEDFAALGGRDAWLEYLEKVPAMWTIYGLVITWDRLSGLLWTLLAGIGAVMVSFATSGGL